MNSREVIEFHPTAELMAVKAWVVPMPKTRNNARTSAHSREAAALATFIGQVRRNADSLLSESALDLRIAGQECTKHPSRQTSATERLENNIRNEFVDGVMSGDFLELVREQRRKRQNTEDVLAL